MSAESPATPASRTPQDGRMKMPYALDARTKQLRRIDEAPDGPAPEMACPACGEGLAAKNAGTAAGHHFVHQGGETECRNQLHETAKQIMVRRLQAAALANEPLDIQTACSVCPGRCYQIIQTGGSGQQGKTGLRIRPTGVYPDVTVVDEKDRPTALIEIVDTNQPEDESDDYRIWTRLPVFIFEVKSPEDLDDLYGDTLEPAKSGNNECRCRKCGRCGFERVCGTDPEAECLVCQEEDRRSEIPWGMENPTQEQQRTCNECEKPPDKDGCIGTHYTRCSCCINSKLVRVEVPCYNDAYDHRHCRSCAGEVIVYAPEDNPHRLYCGSCREEKTLKEDDRPTGEQAVRPKEPKEKREQNAGPPGPDEEKEEKPRPAKSKNPTLF